MDDRELAQRLDDLAILCQDSNDKITEIYEAGKRYRKDKKQEPEQPEPEQPKVKIDEQMADDDLPEFDMKEGLPV